MRWLEPGYAITTADLEDALAAERVTAAARCPSNPLAVK